MMGPFFFTYHILTICLDELGQKKESGDSGTLHTGPFLEDETDFGIYLYNAYMSPVNYFSQDRFGLEPHHHHLLVPSVMPFGLDPHQIIAERNRFVEARIQQRIVELASLPSTMGDGDMDVPPLDPQSSQPSTSHRIRANLFASAQGKTRAMMDLKALTLLNKQRSLRAQIADRMIHGSLVPMDRKELRRFRKPSLNDVRTTEALERKQRQDRERRAKQKHLDYLSIICQHGQTQVLQARRSH